MQLDAVWHRKEAYDGKTAFCGARMRAIRQERKISVKQVMEYMGFESTQAVYKWEAGKCFPQADNLIALAILYRVSPMELLVEEDLVPSSSHIWGNAA